jgi:hypothetical protein
MAKDQLPLVKLFSLAAPNAVRLADDLSRDEKKGVTSAGRPADRHRLGLIATTGPGLPDRS